ncbi:pyrroloquinoline quinone-dependent dehydrogenase [Cyclobacterium sp. 1_MG-2023]|uniref:pyrroloquinoline quinone-dependent dehydrogenase n=1 Tax=Cyclobacterium sp. 1_MG-2023 TaxID=3062681 RepID=UPI0026E39B6A|nr:pyrroloquinoline quinone-dependent dehydrogenase [Cyclobacterium sp. 1_MG-2023]MDO6439145.1 pyrroloquinoline quinone-dependent dehydrogenase [Cyclobacterium sp. 1_MG-2023]
MIRKINSVIALVCLLVSFACSQGNDTSKAKDYQTWENYRATKTAAQFSGLDQINKENVHLLQPAWTYHTGDPKERTPMECNPMILGNVMYVSSPQLDLIALDAEKGTELWRFDPEEYGQSGGVNRGFFHYREGDKIRVFMAVGYYLFAIDAQSGELITEFAEEGKLDLRKNLGFDPESLSISLSTPGIVFQDLIIIGSATGEGYDASPGHIRAYNAKTGSFEWIFHTIPKEGEFGHDSWRWLDGENYGGANNWGGLSLDEEQGWVYVSTGSPAYDFYGGNRIGENLFGNSIVALDAATGERKWHYQAVTHDVWDYDLPCAATLVDIPSENGMVKALVQPTKMGELIILDRLTGESLMDMEVRNAPPSYVPGEVAHPTQKFNQGIAVVRQGLDSTTLTNISAEANAYVKGEFKKYRNEGLYTPPSLEGTLTNPATRGGMIWGGASYDPDNQMLYVNANEIPMILQLRNISENKEGKSELVKYPGRSTYLSNCSNCHGAELQGLDDAFPSLKGLKDRHTRESLTKIITHGNGLMPAFQGFSSEKLNALVDFLLDEEPTSDPIHEIKEEVGTTDRYVLQGFRIFTDEEGFPGSMPPWGTLNAIDLKTKTIKWKVPLGEYPKLKERGVPATGTQNFGGCVATAGGLVFMGGTPDEMFRAFDVATGEILWEYKLPFGGYAVPAVYEVKGKQYVVIAAGGANRLGTPAGDAYVAFALPEM